LEQLKIGATGEKFNGKGVYAVCSLYSPVSGKLLFMDRNYESEPIAKFSVRPICVNTGPVRDILAKWRPMGYLKDDLGHLYLQLNDPRNISIFAKFS